MHGGSTDLDIDVVYFALKTRYRDEEGDRRTTLARKRVARRRATARNGVRASATSAHDGGDANTRPDALAERNHREHSFGAA
ncbi:sporulation protein [Halomarina oriensis]|nr:sporulation protein [Halomarina oriensis]